MCCDGVRGRPGQRRVDRLRTTLQMLWADELLENQDQVQADLADSADLFVRRGRWSLLALRDALAALIPATRSPAPRPTATEIPRLPRLPTFDS